MPLPPTGSLVTTARDQVVMLWMHESSTNQADVAVVAGQMRPNTLALVLARGWGPYAPPDPKNNEWVLVLTSDGSHLGWTHVNTVRCIDGAG